MHSLDLLRLQLSVAIGFSKSDVLVRLPHERCSPMWDHLIRVTKTSEKHKKRQECCQHSPIMASFKTFQDVEGRTEGLDIEPATNDPCACTCMCDYICVTMCDCVCLCDCVCCMCIYVCV